MMAPPPFPSPVLSLLPATHLLSAPLRSLPPSPRLRAEEELAELEPFGPNATCSAGPVP